MLCLSVSNVRASLHGVLEAAFGQNLFFKIIFRSPRPCQAAGLLDPFMPSFWEIAPQGNHMFPPCCLQLSQSALEHLAVPRLWHTSPPCKAAVTHSPLLPARSCQNMSSQRKSIPNLTFWLLWLHLRTPHFLSRRL